tara:strand:- start:11 stop:310 length:300 start_codon:yes stop_codon:yes gene_type:complete
MIHNLIHLAILKINPNARFQIIDNDTNKITWTDDTTPISKSEIESKLIEVQAEYDAEEYKRNRKAEYPLIEDQLDEIYHNGIDGWKKKIKAVKDKYPKG